MGTHRRAGDGNAGDGAEGVAGMPHPFVGEALALDLVNTEVVVRGTRRDLLATPADLVAWWRAAAGRHPSAGFAGAPPIDDPALLPAAKVLRGALRALLGAVADRRAAPTDHLAVVNRVLATGSEAVVVGADGALRAAYPTREPGPEATLLPIARSALALLTERDPARLHRCGNERCVLMFYDTSKSATRRWCSVACMDRARSAQRYRARKQGSGGNERTG